MAFCDELSQTRQAEKVRVLYIQSAEQIPIPGKQKINIATLIINKRKQAYTFRLQKQMKASESREMYFLFFAYF